MENNILKLKYFFCSLVISFMGYGIFIYPHYSQDTYEKALFVNAWPLSEGISSGRYTYWIVDTLIYQLFKTRAINNAFTNLLCIFFFGIAIYYMLHILLQNDKKKNKFILVLCSAAVFVNPCFVDWFQFPECNIVYSFGLFLSIMCASTLYNVKYRWTRRYSYSAFLLIVTVGIYQPLINFYLITALLLIWKFYVYSDRNNVRKILGDVAKRVLLCIAVYMTASIAQIIITSIGSTNSRVHNDYLQNIKIVLAAQGSLWTMQSVGSKTYVYIFLFLTVTIIFVIALYKKMNKNFLVSLIVFLVLYIGLYGASFATHIMAEPWLSQRTTAIFYAHIVLIIYALYTISDAQFDKIIIGLVSFLLCVYIYKSVDLTVQNLKNNVYDGSIVYMVTQYIDSYEKASGNKIDTIAVANDKYVTWSYPDIHASYDLNVRVWCYNWAISGMIYHYTGRLYDIVSMSDIEKMKRFGDVDWQYFNIEQLSADGNTLYMMIY